MIAGWKEYTVADVISTVIDYRGKTPKKLGGDWSDSGYRALSAKNIKMGKIVQLDSIRYVSEEMYRCWMKEEVQKGDILITSEAPFGQIYYWDSDEKIVLSQRLFAVRVNESFYPKYIYFYMTSSFFQAELDGRATGTTVVGLRQPELLKCKIFAPEYQEQKRIADILWCLEQKVNNNEAINENLLQQAQAIFKDRFLINVDMPDNWKCMTLGDVSEMSAGGDKPKIISNQKTEECQYPIYANGISDEGLYGFTTHYKISAESVTVSARGTIGFVCLRHLPYTPIVRLVTLVPHQSIISAQYLFLWLKSIPIHGTGTTQQQLTVPDFRKTEIIIPTKAEMIAFTETVAPLFQQMWSNQDENAKLAELRNALLPRLMSGELDVSDIDI
ncbi:MAG: hypothetical protein HFI16_11420 [Lachnospiraceae bacterium]|nr:hypothetical protein [Lachnospiraceae bacterium]